MKILILSDANSVHTLKWVKSLKKTDYKLMLFSLFKPNNDFLNQYDELKIVVRTPNLRSRIKNLREPNLSKLNYFRGLFYLNRIISDYEPDILHAHYASSYGVLASLSRFRPFVLSVWGSDILDFPNRNFLNKWLINKVINSANSICSTSEVMIKCIREEYNISDVDLIPFGVDIDVFSPIQNLQKNFIVGTIKSVEKHNGIDCFLDAAKIIVYDYKNDKIQFLIVGKGSLLKKMKQKTVDLDLQKYVKFEGHVSQDNIVEHHRKLSLFIAVSTRESFGVAVLEAAACGVPSITSNVGGLPEVNKHEHTGLIIKPNDPGKLAESIIRLYEDNNYRYQLSENARSWVVNNFDWDENLNKMINVYKKVYDKKKS